MCSERASRTKSWLLGPLLLSLGCGSSTAGTAATAAPGASSEEPSPRATEGVVVTAPEAEALPSYFTVELAASGQVFADGTPVVDEDELRRRARVAASELSRAALLGDPATQSPRLLSLFELLMGAGFEHVRFGARPAQTVAAASTAAPRVPPAAPPPPRASAAPAPPLPPAAQPREVPVAPSPSAPQAGTAALPAPVATPQPPPLPPPPAPAPPPPKPPPAAPPRAVAKPAPRPRVTLQTVGLRVSGSGGTEAERAALVQAFERNFERFRACYPLAEGRDQNASYGVDLHVPRAGGNARVRDVRSRLTGERFRQCMERAFTAIKLAPPSSGQDTMVSYSVLFKPEGG